MTQIRQYYGAGGVPFTLPGTPEEIAAAWRSHRQRLRSWFTALPEDRWADASRCADWQVVDLARHLISGAQFLGYTLHHARKGEATRLLEGFDAQQTPVATAAQFADLAPADLLEQLTAMDARVEAGLGSWGGGAAAEAPMGKVPTHVAVNHFLFDSWVHERDLMLPADELPPTDPNEVAMVVSYVVGLAGLAQASDSGLPPPTSLQMQLTDLDRRLHVEVTDVGTTVTFTAPEGPADVHAKAGDLIDFATGRMIDEELAADQRSLDFLGRLATAMG